MNTTAPIIVDRTTTWHAIGKSVEECKDLEGALAASGLDYTVEKRPVYGRLFGEDKLIPNRFVTTRDNDGHMYDIVSDKFEIVQNREAFDFVNYMGDDLQFRKAGETKEEGKFMAVTFHPGLMNVILQHMSAVGITA